MWERRYYVLVLGVWEFFDFEVKVDFEFDFLSSILRFLELCFLGFFRG